MASPTASDRAARVVAGLATALLVAAPRAARAEGSALAQSLFDRARILMDEGKFGEACPLLVESQRLDPGGGTQLNLAVCWEGAGRLATANEVFHEALGQAIRDGRADRKAIAEEHIAGIAPRLSTLAIEVPATSRVPDLRIHVDGTELATVAWGVPAAVDGGPHRIDAAAPGRRPWSTTVQVGAEGDRAQVSVPELVLGAPAARPPPAPPAGTVVVPRDERVCPPGMRVAGDTCEPLPTIGRHFTTGAWITGGVGLGIVAFGAIAGGVALSVDADAADEAAANGCNAARNYCPSDANLSSARATGDDAETWGWISTVALATGATTFVVALALPRELDARTPRPVAIVTPSVAYLGVQLGAR